MEWLTFTNIVPYSQIKAFKTTVGTAFQSRLENASIEEELVPEECLRSENPPLIVTIVHINALCIRGNVQSSEP